MALEEPRENRPSPVAAGGGWKFALFWGCTCWIGICVEYITKQETEKLVLGASVISTPLDSHFLVT